MRQIQVSDAQYAFERSRIREQLAVHAFESTQDRSDANMHPAFSIEDYSSDLYMASYGYCLDAREVV